VILVAVEVERVELELRRRCPWRSNCTLAAGTRHAAPGSIIPNLGETVDIGSDTRTGVDDHDYEVPFPFTGKIVQVAFKLGPLLRSMTQLPAWLGNFHDPVARPSSRGDASEHGFVQLSGCCAPHS
jgi:hypothetical protein